MFFPHNPYASWTFWRSLICWEGHCGQYYIVQDQRQHIEILLLLLQATSGNQDKNKMERSESTDSNSLQKDVCCINTPGDNWVRKVKLRQMSVIQEDPRNASFHGESTRAQGHVSSNPHSRNHLSFTLSKRFLFHQVSTCYLDWEPWKCLKFLWLTQNQHLHWENVILMELIDHVLMVSFIGMMGKEQPTHDGTSDVVLYIGEYEVFFKRNWREQSNLPA